MALPTHTFSRAFSPIAVVAALSLALAGCKTAAPATDDAALTASIQKQIAADSAVAGQPIATVVTSGVATLSGSVGNDAQRTIAARDAASVTGVKEVVNNISLASAQAVAPLPAPLPYASSTNRPSAVKPQPNRQPAPIERHDDRQNDSQRAYNQAPSTQQAPYQPQPTVQPPPAAPAFRNVTVPSGNAISVRITETLDSATTQSDTTFSGVLASDVLVDGLVAIPAGAAVSGHVDEVHEAGHFKGNALITVSLTEISRRGDRIAVTSEPYTITGKGRGVNTAEKTGGGAAVGAILGGIFGGGKGAAIGAGAGAGVGAGSNAITRGQQVQIASESVVRFRLANPITVRVRTDGARSTSQDVRGDGLERHRNNNGPDQP